MPLPRNVFLSIAGFRATRGSAMMARRAFSAGPTLSLKESSTHTDPDYDKHKQESLEQQKRGQGRWKRELASDSEEAVKADNEAHEDLTKLQERTKRDAEEAHKSGTS